MSAMSGTGGDHAPEHVDVPGASRRRTRVALGSLAAALGMTLLTPAPAGAVALAPETLFDTATFGYIVDDTAVADPLAATAPAIPEGLLSLGDKGTQVSWVQKVLGVTQTGYYGKATAAAVVRFQERMGVSSGTGLVGPLTLAQLKAYSARQQAARKTAAAQAAAEAARKAAAAKKAAAARAAAQQEATRSTRTSTTSGDPTMTSSARTSRSARAAISLSTWVSSPHARYVADRESHFRCTAVSPGGAYRGKWQMSASLWKGYGGLNYAPTADQASCAEQDKVAYRVWIAQWWYPWGG